MLLSDLLAMLAQSPLTDVFVPGFIDDGTGDVAKRYLPPGARKFHPLSDNMYLALANRLLRLHAPEDHGRMSVAPAERIECEFDIDPDDVFGIVPVWQSRRTNSRVVRLDTFLGEGCDSENCVFAALGLMLDDSDYIFFNPMDFDGIQIGGAPSRDRWIASVFEGYSMRWYYIGGT